MSRTNRSVKRAAARTGAQGRAQKTARAYDRPRAVTYLHRHSRVVLGAIMALYFLLSFLTFLPQPHTGGDSAHYLTLARSLLQLHSYTDLYDPLQAPHTKYPPVFPLVLALGMIVGLKSWVQLKILMVVIGGAAVALTHLWIRRRGRPVLAAGVAVVLAVSPGVLDQTHWLLSDVPFWLFTMLALWGFERLRPHDWQRLVVAVVAMTLAYFTRSAGLPLLLACVAWLAWRRRWTQLAGTIAVIAPLAVLWWMRARNTGGVAYAQEFWFINPYRPELGMIGIAELFQRIGENAVKYATIHVPILLTGRVGGALTLLTLLITAAALFGWVTRLRRAMVTELLVPLYIGLLFVWPAVWSGGRFILPIFPLLLYYAGIGFARAFRRLPPATLLVTGAVAAGGILIMMTPALSAAVTNGRACTAQFLAGERYPCLYGSERAFFDAAEWAPAALPADAVVLSRKPRLFHAISGGVRGTNYPMSAEPAVFFALADSVNARYVVYDRLTSLADRYLAPVLLSRPAAFCIMQAFGADGTAVFGIRQGVGSVTPPPSGTPTDGQFQACDDAFWKTPPQRAPVAQ